MTTITMMAVTTSTTQSSLGLSSLIFVMKITNFVKRVRKLQVKSNKRLLLFLLGNHLATTMFDIFKDALLTTRKFHSLTEICVRWILLIGFLIWKSILIFVRFVMKKKCGLHLINWTMKQRNGGKRFKLIENGKVSIQSALGKE